MGGYEVGVFDEVVRWVAAVIRPLFLAGVGAGALYFLVAGRIGELMRYALAVVVIGAFVFAPDAVIGVAEGIAGVIVGGGPVTP